MAAGRGLGLILLVVVAGLVVGSLLGELLGGLFPADRTSDLIVCGPSIGPTPPRHDFRPESQVEPGPGDRDRDRRLHPPPSLTRSGPGQAILLGTTRARSLPRPRPLFSHRE